jgi:diguanylate cyclase (GGDEF)-like protein
MSGEPGTSVRILVVDDSKVILRAAQKILGAEFDVITAADGEDAWEQLVRDSAIQVVFTDLAMPRTDGYDLLQKVRTAAEPGIQNMPVIVVTGTDNDESERLKALGLGATDFITKPFTSTDLVARARAHAKYQRITRQLQAQTTLDPLTGLANKPGFVDRLQQDIAYARRHAQALTLMRVEIDDLRAIFLKRGKDAAEQLVVCVSNLLRARIRKEDTAARVGLGGFAISLPGGQVEGIEGMVERLHAEVAASPPEVDGEPVPIQLIAVVLSAELEHWPNAQEAMDRSQALLDSARERHATPSTPLAVEQSQRHGGISVPDVPAPLPPPSPPLPEEVAFTAPSPSLPEETVAAAPAAPIEMPEALRLDPLLDQVKQGRTRDVIEQMPQVIKLLVPLLRLLSAKQRAQLIGFLETLGGE